LVGVNKAGGVDFRWTNGVGPARGGRIKKGYSTPKRKREEKGAKQTGSQREARKRRWLRNIKLAWSEDGCWGEGGGGKGIRPYWYVDRVAQQKRRREGRVALARAPKQKLRSFGERRSGGRLRGD